MPYGMGLKITKGVKTSESPPFGGSLFGDILGQKDEDKSTSFARDCMGNEKKVKFFGRNNFFNF